MKITEHNFKRTGVIYVIYIYVYNKLSKSNTTLDKEEKKEKNYYSEIKIWNNITKTDLEGIRNKLQRFPVGNERNEKT